MSGVTLIISNLVSVLPNSYIYISNIYYYYYFILDSLKIM